jgi:hypothetical protein
MVMANDDSSGIDDLAREKEVRAAVYGRDDGGYWVAGDEELGFSWEPCDCCRSPLGGDRHSAAVLGD